MTCFGHVPGGTAIPHVANPRPPAVEPPEFVPLRFGPTDTTPATVPDTDSETTPADLPLSAPEVPGAFEPVDLTVQKSIFDELERVNTRQRALATSGTVSLFATPERLCVRLGKARLDNFVIRDPVTSVRRISRDLAQQEIRKIQRLAESAAAFPLRKIEEQVEAAGVGNWVLEDLDINEPRFGSSVLDSFVVEMRWSS